MWNGDKLRPGFITHYEYIRTGVPETKRLEYRVQDEWAPLCQFLDAKVPEQTFPSVNDADHTVRVEHGVENLAWDCTDQDLCPGQRSGNSGLGSVE